MQPSPNTSFTCDSLIEFEEDAAPFAQAQPEFVNPNGREVTPATPSPSEPASPQDRQS